MLAVIPDSHNLVGDDFDIEANYFKSKGIDLRVEHCESENDIINVCKDADAVLVVYAPITRNVINSLGKCRVYVRYGIGFDNIDIISATEKGIPVCNIPDYCQPEVATHAMALLLSFERKIVLLNDSTQQGHWNPNLGFESRRLSSLTLGLLGFGSIARQLASYVKGFDMKVIAYDPFISKDSFEKFGVKKVDINQLYSESDYISVHVPLNDNTYHLVGSASFDKMKKTAVIINTARGPIIDENALVDALKTEKIRGACLDVVENEPLTPQNELCNLNNVILTPHSAYNSVEAKQSLHLKVAETATAILNGKKPFNIVNKKELGI